MNINSYASFFHDGSIIGFEQDNLELVILIESGELSENDLEDEIILSEYSTLKGKLHLKNPSIWIDSQPFLGKLRMLADSYFILDFGLKANELILFVQLVNYKENRESEEYLEIKIHATDIYWENIPNLFDPFKQSLK